MSTMNEQTAKKYVKVLYMNPSIMGINQRINVHVGRTLVFLKTTIMRLFSKRGNGMCLAIL